MNYLSIHHSITIVRGVEPVRLLEQNSALWQRLYGCGKFAIHEVPAHRSGFELLGPFTHSLPHKYLFLMGQDGSFAVYSNYASGGSMSLTRVPRGADLRFDSLSVNYEFPRKRCFAEHGEKSSNCDNTPLANFVLDARKNLLTVRFLRCVSLGGGGVAQSEDGEPLPFEDPKVTCAMQDGILPSRSYVNQFVRWMGWPRPCTDEFGAFVSDAFVAEFELPKQDKHDFLPSHLMDYLVAPVTDEDEVDEGDSGASRLRSIWEHFCSDLKRLIGDRYDGIGEILLCENVEEAGIVMTKSGEIASASPDCLASPEDYVQTYMNIAHEPDGYPFINGTVLGVGRGGRAYVLVEFSRWGLGEGMHTVKFRS